MTVGELRPAGRRLKLSYLLVVVLPLLGVATLLIVSRSGSIHGGSGPGPDLTAQLLVSVLVVMLAARGFGAVARRLGQPPVLGEIIAGLCLGPSLLGLVAPKAQAWLFPAGLQPVLHGLAELGLVALMFVVGREAAATSARAQGWLVPAIAQACVAGPFLAGMRLAIPLFHGWAGPHAGRLTFELFLGTTLSITALPVLARILSIRAMTGTDVGRLSLLSAAVADAGTWCLMAVVVAAGSGSGATAVRTVALTVGFGTVLLVFGRKLLRRYADAPGVLLGGLVLAGAATAAIGITPVFGAFAYGLVCPPSPAAATLTDRLERTVAEPLLPFFFLGTGLVTDIWRGSFGPDQLLVAVAVLVVAVAGKTTGPYVMARSARLGHPDALRLAALLNTRGLTELVVLNLGLSLGLLSPGLFTVLLAMALITTMATVPLLRLIDRRYPLEPGPGASLDQGSLPEQARG